MTSSSGSSESSENGISERTSLVDTESNFSKGMKSFGILMCIPFIVVAGAFMFVWDAIKKICGKICGWITIFGVYLCFMVYLPWMKR